jgi:hypothetical protein
MNVLLVESKTADCTVVLKDGTRIDVNSWDLFNKDLHHFKGWACTAGTDSIIVESDFQVWSGVCRNDNLGNLFDDDFSLLQTPTVCTKDQCTTCPADLINNKKRN